MSDFIANVKNLRFYDALQVLGFATLGLFWGQDPKFSQQTFIFFAAVFLHGLYVFTVNDLCDLERDLQNPRRPEVHRYRKSILLGLTIGLFIASLLLSFSLPFLTTITLIGVTVVGTTYSIPGFFFKGRPPMAQIFHFIAGAGWVLAGAFLYSTDLQPESVGVAILAGLLFLSGGTFNELMDRDADREAGVFSLTQSFSKKAVLITVFLIQVLILLSSFLVVSNLWVYVITISYLASCGPSLWAYLKNDSSTLLFEFQQQYRFVFAMLVFVFFLHRF